MSGHRVFRLVSVFFVPYCGYRYNRRVRFILASGKREGKEMRRGKFLVAGVVLALMSLPLSSLATVSEEQANRLGRDLMPTGGLRAGNAEGTIPEWRGGLERREIDLNQPDPLGDPFGDDPMRFRITAENMAQFRDQLTPGHIAMLEAYSDTYTMPVYPTRRSTSYPDYVYEWTRYNAVNAELEGRDGLRGAYMGVPFPIPTRGEHPIWNHKMRYRGEGARVFNNRAIVNTAGDYFLVRIVQEVLFFYHMQDYSPERLDESNEHLRYMEQTVSPSRLAGNVLLVHEPIDQLREQRQAWIYNPGQRRVRRAPNVEHDNPSANADGLLTNDQTDVFNGSLNRYDWELVGRQEFYMPYNSYRLQSTSLTYDQILQAGHINQDLARYELRRVWVVDARVRYGVRHLFPRRTFYVDEDSWQILSVDIYDNRGQLWRVHEAHNVNFYNAQAVTGILEATYDLQSRRYIAVGLGNEDPVSDYRWTESPSYFTPAQLRRGGRR